MKTRHFCTYFDHNYLPRAMVMLESLYAHNPHAFVYVLCLSEQCHDAMQKLAYPFVRLISMPDFESANPDLVAVRPTRSLVEYYFTITPCLPWHILHTEDGIDAITYLDADMMFFSSVEPIFEEAGDASVILTPHRFSEFLRGSGSGQYNVSWITFRTTLNGLRCLAWYKDVCLDWCYDRVEGDRFADQKYLERFKVIADDVHDIMHQGVGVASWNIFESSIYLHNCSVYIDNSPLVFFHAQGFKPMGWKCYDSGFSLVNIPLTSEIRKYIFAPYIKHYKQSLHLAKKMGVKCGYVSQRFANKKNLYSAVKYFLRETYHGRVLVG